MTTPDRTEELVRAMLARRAGGTVPDWLLAETMRQVVQGRQSRRRASGPFGGPDGARLALIAAVALSLLALASVLAAGAFLRRDDDLLEPPALVVDGPSPSGASDASFTPEASGDTHFPPSTPAAAESVVVPATAKPVADVLNTDSLAVVTPDGDGLRVRSQPGLAADSTRLEPLLASGTRVLIVGGPVQADGFAWYEVLVDPGQEDLFGWVAAGKDANVWIRADPPDCPEALDVPALRATPTLELFVCFGSAPLTMRTSSPLRGWNADTGDPTETSARPCADGSCGEPVWMYDTALLTRWRDGDTSVPAAIEGDKLAIMNTHGPLTPIRVTIALDAPSAQECRPPERSDQSTSEAVIRCRLRFVVLDAAPGRPEVFENTLATSDTDIEVWGAPGGDDANVAYTIPAVAAFYVDEIRPASADDAWVAVTPEDEAIGAYGWVYAGPGEPRLQTIPVECPGPDAPGELEALSPVRRLVCSDGSPVDMTMSPPPPAPPAP